MNIFFSKCWNLIENMIKICLVVIFDIFHKELNEDFCNSIIQFVKFGIVGVSNTLISYVVYVVSLFGIQSIGLFKSYNYIIAQVIQFILSVLWCFYWNEKKVFVLKEGQQRSVFKSLIKTYVTYSFTGLFLSSALLYLWISVLGISEYVAPIINLVVSVPINFLISKFWAYKYES